jgi:hypothetical protein
VLRKRFLLVCLLFLAAGIAGAQASPRPEAAGNTQNNRSGTWSAANSNGRTFMGTWTARLDSTGAAVTGTWTLIDAERRTLAQGGWSAAKSPTQWTGAWRAIVSGRPDEYSGTWNAAVDLKGDARFADLFEKAILAVVGGTWHSGTNSGAWSIRAAKREGAP